MAQDLHELLARELSSAEKAHRIAAFINDPETRIRMRAVNDHGTPPIAEVGRYLREDASDIVLNDFAKTLVGKMVRVSLARSGLEPGRKAAVRQPNVFASGALYIVALAKKAA
jgi:hypothetical protein